MWLQASQSKTQPQIEAAKPVHSTHLLRGGGTSLRMLTHSSRTPSPRLSPRTHVAVVIPHCFSAASTLLSCPRKKLRTLPPSPRPPRASERPAPPPPPGQTAWPYAGCLPPKEFECSWCSGGCNLELCVVTRGKEKDVRSGPKYVRIFHKRTCSETLACVKIR